MGVTSDALIDGTIPDFSKPAATNSEQKNLLKSSVL
jgi:hypothetical protein